MSIPNPYAATWPAATGAYHYTCAIRDHGEDAVALKLAAHYRQTENLSFPDALGAAARTMKVMDELISGDAPFKDLRNEMDQEARNTAARPAGNAVRQTG